MKGLFVDLLTMVVIAVLVVGVFSLWFSGKATAQPPALIQEAKPACRNHQDCTGNLDGSICISIQGGPVFCGCLLDSDCDGIGIEICKENKCQ